MAECVDNCTKSVAHTFNSLVSGDCYKNFANASNSRKAIVLAATVVAGVAIGILFGLIPVIGPVIAVPIGLFTGLAVFSKMTESPREGLLNKDRSEMKKVSFKDMLEGYKTCNVFKHFKGLSQFKQGAIITVTAVAAIGVGILLGAIPYVGLILGIAGAIFTASTVFSYCTLSQRSTWNKLTDKYEEITTDDKDKLGVRAKDRVVGAVEAVTGRIGALLTGAKGSAAPGEQPELSTDEASARAPGVELEPIGSKPKEKGTAAPAPAPEPAVASATAAPSATPAPDASAAPAPSASAAPGPGPTAAKPTSPQVPPRPPMPIRPAPPAPGQAVPAQL